MDCASKDEELHMVFCQDSIFFSGNGVAYLYAFYGNTGLLGEDKNKWIQKVCTRKMKAYLLAVFPNFTLVRFF